MLQLMPGGFLKTDGDGQLASLVVDTDTLVVNVSSYEDKVGINTATPRGALEVKGLGGDTEFAIVVHASVTSGEFFSFRNSSDNEIMGLQQTGGGDGILRFYDSAGTEGVRFDARPNEENFIRGDLGIGTGVGIAASAGLELKKTNRALLISRLTTAQMNALTAVDGMIIYNTTLNAFAFYENGAWVKGSGLA